MAYEDLRGKCALVTGGSRGIGREIARQFQMYGCNVAVNYNKSKKEADDLKADLASRVEVFGADVSKPEEASALVRDVESKLGPVDILVNNAGIVDGMRFDEYDEKRFRDLWEINFMGTVYVTLASLGKMKEKRSGSIITLGSNFSMGAASSGATYYGVTKTAIVSLTKRIAFELGDYGIRANCIAPGWIRTDMTTLGRTSEQVEEAERIIRSKNALHMIGEPIHIAKLALFLASEDSAFITGQVIVADGGRADYLSHGM